MSSVKLPEVVEKSLDDEFGMRSMDGLLAARRIALLAYKLGIEVGVKAGLEAGAKHSEERGASQKESRDLHYRRGEQELANAFDTAYLECRAIAGDIRSLPEPPIVASVTEGK